MSNATKETVIVLDFGGQYNQLIARRVRECNVYCEILPYTVDIQKIKDINPKGIIFTGGPNSVYDESSPHYTPEIFELGIPILGICYGCQLMAYTLAAMLFRLQTIHQVSTARQLQDIITMIYSLNP